MANTEDKKFMMEYRKFLEEVDKRTSDVVSAYDVIKALGNKVGLYNNVFLKKLDKKIALFNRRNGYNAFTSIDKEKKLRRIGNIGFYVEPDGSYYLKLYYVDGRGKIIGTGIVDNFVKINGCDEETYKNKEELFEYLEYLAAFVSMNRGMEFRWDKLNPIFDTFYVGDELLTCRINPYETSNVEPYWTIESNGAVYGLYDHEYANKLISQCGDGFLKRMEVNLNEIEPLVADIVRKEYNLGGQKLVK